MLYIKTEFDGKPVQVELYGDDIYTRCFNCGKEFHVDQQLLREILNDGGDLSSTQVSCCNNKKPELIRIK